MFNSGTHFFRLSLSGTIPAILAAILLFASCSPVKRLGPDEYLLNKNTIRSDKSELNEGLYDILKQKPNRRILGLFRFHLGVYNLANTGKETKFKSWVKRTIGEEPVILDPTLTKKSKSQILIYAQNEGYFNAAASDSTVFKKRKKANVIYSLSTGQVYSLRHIRYDVSDPLIAFHLQTDSANALLKQGQPFKSSLFRDERERITTLLRNQGYYEFNRLYVSFDVDTALKSYQADVTIRIAGAVEGDSLITRDHKFFRIKDIIVQTDYDPLSRTVSTGGDTVLYKNYRFISSPGKKLQYKPEALVPRIFIEKGQVYKINNADYTYRGLANLSQFKFINVQFEPQPADSSGVYWLNSYIRLTPAIRQDYKVEIEGTHNGGNFGFGGSFTYRNKNSFRGAELFETRLRLRVESIPDFTDSTSDQSNPFLLNTWEFGPEITVRIPRFLWPLHGFNKSRVSNPVTLLTASYNYQSRREYQRDLFILSTGFEFFETQRKKHYVYPAEINFSQFRLSPSFDTTLIRLNDPQLLQYYRDYLITNGRYVFVYNSQEPSKTKDFIFFRFSCEIAGNSLRLFDNLFRPNYDKSRTYNIFKTRYSQYVRPEFDARYYQVFSPLSSLVYRLAAGIGLSYLNSDFVPYEKTFFAGGANDLRAFNPRTIGPGSYKTDNYIEQLGDIKINANIEYRSDIFKFLEGAVFLDAGNIWVRKESGSQPGGKFQAGNFLSELAIGTGIGIRLDFNFFILRFDTGIPLKDPRREVGDRWVISYLKMRSLNLNLGIGYPF